MRIIHPSGKLGQGGLGRFAHVPQATRVVLRQPLAATETQVVISDPLSVISDHFWLQLRAAVPGILAALSGEYRRACLNIEQGILNDEGRGGVRRPIIPELQLSTFLVRSSLNGLHAQLAA